jgi:hypothetical protein
VPETHSAAGSNLILLWTLGLVCCAIGIIFLYKAMTCKVFRETDVAEGKARNFPMWMGRTISVFLGLIGVAAGLAIMMRILKG